MLQFVVFRRWLPILLLSGWFMTASFAQSVSMYAPIPNEGLQARWITQGYAAQAENLWAGFRKVITLPQAPKQPVRAMIAVDSKYWLWINNRLVVFEGALKRGPTPTDTYADEVDIGPYLRAGQNVIAVLVWHWHRDGFCHKNSGQLGLFFNAVSPEVRLISDRTWESMIHPAFGNTSDPQPNFRLPEYNIKFYGGRDIPWRDPARWKMGSATEVGPAGAAPWGRLWKRPFPQWKDSGLVAYTNPVPVGASADSVVMKLPRNLAITPYLKVEADQDGLLIDIRTDNYDGGSEYNVRTEYVTQKGVQEFETYGYMNGHEVIYRLPKGVRVIDLKYRATSFPTEHIGQFHCDDGFLNTLWQKSLNTMDINMRDAIQDADRERSQWWGDAITILGQILYTCDSNGHRAIQKAISNLVEWQKPDGVLYSPVPTGEWSEELPTQMLASVGQYSFWHYYRYTADTATMRYVYPHVKRYLSIWQLGPDSLIAHRDGGWNWFDWGEDIDEKVIENAWYYMALAGAQQMAQLLQQPTDAAAYTQRMAVIKRHFNQKLWNGKAYRAPGYSGQTDDRAQGLAVVAGLAEPGQYPTIAQALQTEYHAGPYLEKYIVEALFQMNRPDQALERIRKRYVQMVSSPITTLWEGWQVKSATYGGGSYNHGWSGGMLTLMHQYVAGIAPEQPGYQRFRVRPQLGDLHEVTTRVPTPHGFIMLSINQTKTQSRLKLTVPPGTEATVSVPLPYSQAKRVQLNGKPYAKRQSSVSQLVDTEPDYRAFVVPVGQWEWVIE